jgi:hypothetical protein
MLTQCLEPTHLRILAETLCTDCCMFETRGILTSATIVVLGLMAAPRGLLPTEHKFPTSTLKMVNSSLKLATLSGRSTIIKLAMLTTAGFIPIILRRVTLAPKESTPLLPPKHKKYTY